MLDPIEEFSAAMLKEGFTPRDGRIRPDDKWHPAYVGGEKGKKSSGTYCMKVLDDGFAVGCFFSWKDQDNKFSWHLKQDSETKTTPEERRAMKKKLDAFRKAKEEQEERRHDKIARLLTIAYKNMKPFPAKAPHPYIYKKGISGAHGVKERAGRGEVIIPLYGPDGRVNTVQRITKDGGKFLFPGGKKKGSYFPFVKKGEKLETILICEGFATGASIRESTGLPVAAAMDSGNIIWTLDVLKKKFPDAKFLICADNDAWTFNESKRPKDIIAKEIPATDPRWEEWREAGMLHNVGIDKARQAAAKCGGASVVYPVFDGLDITGRPTDFNDLAKLAGKEEVARQIMSVVNAIPSKGDTADGSEVSHASNQQPVSGETYPENETYLAPDYPPPEPPPPEQKEVGDFGLAFKCLGHNEGQYYYFSFKERRIVSMSASGHNIQNLLQLDDLDSWYNSKFGNGGEIGEKKLALYAQNQMIRLCQIRGTFREEDSVRGAGAWIDKGRFVINCGKSIVVDGKAKGYNDIDSAYTYLDTRPWYTPNKYQPLTDSEAMMLRQACEMVTWENPMSGMLLAGWLVIAPVCGALEYAPGLQFRPHVWITGQVESGKSTVVRKIVRKVLGRSSINIEGKTSEAFIRNALGYDARPIVLDEAEEGEDLKRVIELARIASTGGTVGKFGQGMKTIRFACCFSGVNPPISKVADESRISMLRIVKNKSKSAQSDFDAINRMLDTNITDEYANRLLARTIENMPTLLENIRVFQRAIREKIGAARASEQMGVMLAGMHLLSSRTPITKEEAEKLLFGMEFGDHTAINQSIEGERTFQHLASYIVRFVSSTTPPCERTLGELIIDATAKGNEEDKFIRRYGIARIGDMVYIASRAHNTSQIFRGTDWENSYSARLADMPGAVRINNSMYFTSGIKTNAVALPIKMFIDTIKQDEPEQEEIAF